MIENVLGNYLDSLDGKEREFDAPFMALLRANGYNNIHFTHGQYEFGKDFIANGLDENGTRCQFVFQTKGGNIGLGDWHPIRGQIDQLRTNPLAHPSFDAELPRRAVLVITGRLIGGAILEAQQYTLHLEQLNELGFITWDREHLIEMFLNSPEVGLVGGENGYLLKTIGQIDRREITWNEIETFSQHWITTAEALSSLNKAAIEASLIANDLRSTNRLDAACFTALCLIRAAWASTHGTEPPYPESVTVAETGKSLFRYYALLLWENCTEDTLDPRKFNSSKEGVATYVTGPVRCLTLVEILGLLGLLENESTPELADEIADYLKRFFEAHAFSTHLVSDKWGVSLIPPILHMAKRGFRAEIHALLKKVVRRTCDHYDHESFGLAGPRATVEEEINYFLGTPLEHVQLNRRSESYIYSVVLDLISILEDGDLYNLARNDFEAVGANPLVIETGDTLGQYVYDFARIKVEPPNTFKEQWNPEDGWKVAAHHLNNEGEQYFLTRNAKFWDHLVLSSVLRDRHYVHTCRAIMAN
ncbi:MAG: hypothetical protein WBD27_14035 [Pyrinomonadaceae bacterium]